MTQTLCLVHLQAMMTCKISRTLRNITQILTTTQTVEEEDGKPVRAGRAEAQGEEDQVHGEMTVRIEEGLTIIEIDQSIKDQIIEKEEISMEMSQEEGDRTITEIHMKSSQVMMSTAV